MNGLERITEDFLERGCISADDARTAQKYFPREAELRKKAEKFISDKKLTYPDLGESMKDGLSDKELLHKIDLARQELNKELPPYSQITKVQLQNEEFEKTAKKSIKRYLYQNMNN